MRINAYIGILVISFDVTKYNEMENSFSHEKSWENHCPISLSNGLPSQKRQLAWKRSVGNYLPRKKGTPAHESCVEGPRSYNAIDRQLLLKFQGYPILCFALINIEQVPSTINLFIFLDRILRILHYSYKFLDLFIRCLCEEQFKYALGIYLCLNQHDLNLIKLIILRLNLCTFVTCVAAPDIYISVRYNLQVPLDIQK